MKPKVDARLAALETAQAAAEGPLRIAFHVLVVDRDPVTGELVTTDPETGKTPNLGANDSAYIFPLTSLDQNDFRPVVDAATAGSAPTRWRRSTTESARMSFAEIIR